MALGTKLGIIALSGAGGSVDTESMIFTITTTAPNEDFVIRGVGGVNNYNVDWGDSNSESGITSDDKTHTYAVAGTYEIKITGDIYIRNDDTTTGAQYTEFKQWGTNTTIRGIREFFANCVNMTYTATDAPNFNFTVSVTYQGPYRLFYNCDGITTLDLSNWNTSAFTGATSGQAFYGMNNVTSINITGWDVSNITSAASWFYNSGNIGAGLTLTAPNLNWSSCTSMSQFFYRVHMVSADISTWTLNSSGTNINQMFRGIGEVVSATGGLSLDLSNWVNTGAVSSVTNLFLLARGITSLNITNWDLSHITDFGTIFSSCYYLEEIIGLDTQRWDSATSMDRAFYQLYRINFDTHNFHNDFGANWSVTTFNQCFFRCGFSLSAGNRGAIPNIVNWDMSNAVNVLNFFRSAHFADNNQTFAPSTSWDLSGLASTDLALFAYDSTGFETWDWSNVTITNAVTSMSQFIRNVTGGHPRTLTTIIFGANCDFSGVTTWGNFAQSQTSLTTLTFDSSVSFAAVTTMSDMLTDVPLNITSYDNLLIRAAATNTNAVVLKANASSFTCAPSPAATAEGTLVGLGWTITDLACT